MHQCSSKCALYHGMRPHSNVSLLLHGISSSKKWSPHLTQWENPHANAPLSPQEVSPCSPPLLLFSHVKNELINALYPPLASFGQALKDQWPRSNLAKSNQWVRYNPKISLRNPLSLVSLCLLIHPLCELIVTL
jgi:hypothetical protein